MYGLYGPYSVLWPIRLSKDSYETNYRAVSQHSLSIRRSTDDACLCVWPTQCLVCIFFHWKQIWNSGHIIHKYGTFFCPVKVRFIWNKLAVLVRRAIDDAFSPLETNQDTGHIMDKKYGTFLFPICLSKIHTRPITSLPAESQEAPRCFPVCSPSVLLYFQLSVWVMRQKWVIFCHVTHFLYIFCTALVQYFDMQLCERCFFLHAIVWRLFFSWKVSIGSVKRRKLLSQQCSRLPEGDHRVWWFAVHCTSAAPKTREQRPKTFGSNMREIIWSIRDAEYRTRMPIN